MQYKHYTQPISLSLFFFALDNFNTHIHYLLTTLHCHTVYNYTVHFAQYYVYTSQFNFILSYYVVHIILLLFIIVILLSFGCSDTEMSQFAGQIKEFGFFYLIIVLLLQIMLKSHLLQYNLMIRPFCFHTNKKPNQSSCGN